MRSGSLRTLCLALAVATFVAVALRTVGAEVRASQWAYDLARQQETAARLQRRVEELESRLLRKFPPELLYEVATRIRAERDGDSEPRS